MKLRTAINMVLLLFLSAWSAAALASSIDVKSYLALRKKLSPVVGRQSPLVAGSVMEIRGRLSGISKRSQVSGEQTKKLGCIIITTETSGSFVVETDSIPDENLGTRLACLVKVVEGNPMSTGGLELLAWTYDVELERAENESKTISYGTTQTKPIQARLSNNTTSVNQSPISKHPKAKPLSAKDYVAIYAKAIKGFNRRLSDSEAETIARSILGFSYRYKLDARLVCAVILAESNFRIDATSRCGAMGLGQLMPGTAAGLGISNPYDPVENVYGSVRYIRSMLDRMSGKKQWNELTWKDLALALAAYNAGPGAVKKHGGIPPYRETQNYVRKVTQIYKKLCGVS
mgnify:CR=1 FL=1